MDEKMVEAMKAAAQREMHRPVPRGTRQTTDELAADIVRAVIKALEAKGFAIVSK